MTILGGPTLQPAGVSHDCNASSKLVGKFAQRMSSGCHMMNESLGPRNARRCGECHVLARMVCNLCGMLGPQRSEFLPAPSLQLRIQELGAAPRVAQWTSETWLLTMRSCSGVGRLRLEIVRKRRTFQGTVYKLLQSSKTSRDEAIIWPKRKEGGCTRCSVHAVLLLDDRGMTSPTQEPLLFCDFDKNVRLLALQLAQ